MTTSEWKKLIKTYDERRNIIIPGKADQTVLFAVEQFIAIANESIAARGAFFTALSGGSTPKAIFELLSAEPYRTKVDWDKVYIFWSDERNVPMDHPDSNYHMAMKAGLNTLPIPRSHIFKMPTAEDIESGAVDYEQLISTVLPSQQFDLVMLGMGDDGHTASLFPHTKALHCTNRLVAANYVPQKNTWRMTLTYACINSARHIIIYVIGASKADMLKHVLEAQYNPDELPVQRIGTPSHKALWLVDSEAGKYLQSHY